MILESMSKELIIRENAEFISRGAPHSQERENLLKSIEKREEMNFGFNLYGLSEGGKKRKACEVII